MFKLPRSSWADYDKTKISKGGAVFERSAKLVTLTPEIKECFGLTADEVKPSELVRAMLKSPVDMLWFGGIGTFIKSSTESHTDVGDKANDSLRVDGRDIRAKVLAEGANLGATQAGRVEYALKGGRLNTDAIDNSAGVDTSDHEVNIKILLNDLVRRKKMTLEQRDKLLVEMTDEVAALVLRDNYLQTQILSVTEFLGLERADSQMRLMRALEKTGLLDRILSGLPTDEELATRVHQGKALTRSESAVLLAYSKIALYDGLLESSLPDDPALTDDLVAYFPSPIQKNLKADLEKHQLRREIIATGLTNDLINHMGATFVATVVEKTGFKSDDITRAYRIIRDTFQLSNLWQSIESLDLKVSAKAQLELFHDIEKFVARAVPWILIHGKYPLNIVAETKAYQKGVQEVQKSLKSILNPADFAMLEHHMDALVGMNIPLELAQRVALLSVMVSALDIVRISRKMGASLTDTAHTYFALGNAFSLEWLRDQTSHIKTDTPWQQQAVNALADDFFALQGSVTAHVLEEKGASGQAKLDAWLSQNKQIVQRVQTLLTELRAVSSVDIAMLTVVSRHLRELIAD